MFIALDIRQKRTDIENAIKGEMYFCPCCRESVTTRMGDVRAHHYAHMPTHDLSHTEKFCEERVNSKYYEMSRWHKEWQGEFKEEEREVWFSGKENERQCRADVYLADVNKVIEFQHSNLPLEEFERRNKFYNERGMHVMWLFDFNPLFERNKISKMSLWDFSELRQKVLREKNQWVYSISCYEDKFGRLTVQDSPNIEIFFSYTDEKGNERIRKLVWTNRYFNEVTTENVGSRNQFLNRCREHVRFVSDEEIAEIKKRKEEQRAKEEAAARAEAERRQKEQERIYKENLERFRREDEERLRQEEQLRKEEEECEKTREYFRNLAKDEAGKLEISISQPAGPEKYDSFLGRCYGLTDSYFRLGRNEYISDRQDELAAYYTRQVRSEYIIRLKDIITGYGRNNGNINEIISFYYNDAFVNGYDISQEQLLAWFKAGTEEAKKKKIEEIKALTINDNAPDDVLEAFMNYNEDAPFVKYGTRWVVCTDCGRILPAKFFTSYGGEKTVNEGICEECYPSHWKNHPQALSAPGIKKDWSKICPDCESELVLRNGRYGEFYACTNRNCRYTRSVKKR